MHETADSCVKITNFAAVFTFPLEGRSCKKPSLHKERCQKNKEELITSNVT